MPFKHTVTDSRGKVHTRTSANRSYPFAVVIHLAPWTTSNGEVVPGRSICNWAGSERLARASVGRYSRALAHEIIPCTPVPTGKHLQAVADAQVDAEISHERKQLGS